MCSLQESSRCPVHQLVYEGNLPPCREKRGLKLSQLLRQSPDLPFWVDIDIYLRHWLRTLLLSSFPFNSHNLFIHSVVEMSSPSQSLDGPTETHEMKSDIRDKSLDVPTGEAIGERSEDYDLSQFGYKPELEVSIFR